MLIICRTSSAQDLFDVPDKEISPSELKLIEACKQLPKDPNAMFCGNNHGAGFSDAAFQLWSFLFGPVVSQAAAAAATPEARKAAQAVGVNLETSGKWSAFRLHGNGELHNSTTTYATVYVPR